jgi:hypothetical protein
MSDFPAYDLIDRIHVHAGAHYVSDTVILQAITIIRPMLPEFRFAG